MKRMFIIANGIFLAYVLSLLSNASFLSGILTGYIAVVLPGTGWVKFVPWCRYGKVNPAISLITIILTSGIICISGLLFFMVLPIAVTQWRFFFYLVFVTNMGLLIGNKNNLNLLSGRETAIFIILTIFLGFIAAEMPLMRDQDVHRMITAYGLVYELKPYNNVSRVPYYFDHPVFPHILSATTILLMGEEGEGRHCYARAKKIELEYRGKDIWRHWEQIPDTDEGKEERYLSEKRKLLFAARIPHFFIAAAMLMLCYSIIYRETGSFFSGICILALLMSPELIVRYPVAAYTSFELFIFLAMIYVYLYSPDKYKSLAALVVGFFAAWISKKVFFVPIVIFFYDRICFLKKGKYFWADSFLWGYIIGMVTIVIYGWTLNWSCFYHCFFVDHGIIGLMDGIRNIPGFFTAWTKAALYMNPIIFTAGLGSIFYLLLTRMKKRIVILPLCFLFGSLLFIISKWPHMKNCAIVYPALLISLVYVISNGSVRWLPSASGIINWRRNVLIMLLVVHFANLFLLLETIKDPNLVYSLNESKNTPKCALYEYYNFIVK